MALEALKLEDFLSGKVADDSADDAPVEAPVEAAAEAPQGFLQEPLSLDEFLGRAEPSVEPSVEPSATFTAPEAQHRTPEERERIRKDLVQAGEEGEEGEEGDLGGIRVWQQFKDWFVPAEKRFYHPTTPPVHALHMPQERVQKTEEELTPEERKQALEYRESPEAIARRGREREPDYWETWEKGNIPPGGDFKGEPGALVPIPLDLMEGSKTVGRVGFNIAGFVAKLGMRIGQWSLDTMALARPPGSSALYREKQAELYNKWEQTVDKYLDSLKSTHMIKSKYPGRDVAEEVLTTGGEFGIVTVATSGVLAAPLTFIEKIANIAVWKSKALQWVPGVLVSGTGTVADLAVFEASLKAVEGGDYDEILKAAGQTPAQLTSGLIKISAGKWEAVTADEMVTLGIVGSSAILGGIFKIPLNKKYEALAEKIAAQQIDHLLQLEKRFPGRLDRVIKKLRLEADAGVGVDPQRAAALRATAENLQKQQDYHIKGGVKDILEKEKKAAEAAMRGMKEAEDARILKARKASEEAALGEKPKYSGEVRVVENNYGRVVKKKNEGLVPKDLDGPAGSDIPIVGTNIGFDLEGLPPGTTGVVKARWAGGVEVEIPPDTFPRTPSSTETVTITKDGKTVTETRQSGGEDITHIFIPKDKITSVEGKAYKVGDEKDVVSKTNADGEQETLTNEADSDVTGDREAAWYDQGEGPPDVKVGSMVQVGEMISSRGTVKEITDEGIVIAWDNPVPGQEEYVALFGKPQEGADEVWVLGDSATKTTIDPNGGPPVVTGHSVDPKINEPPQRTPPLGESGLPELPRDLKGAKPRYGELIPQFSDLDKALYVVANVTKKSVHDERYMSWLREQLPDLTDGEIRLAGKDVKDYLKELVGKTAVRSGDINIPDSGIGPNRNDAKLAPQFRRETYKPTSALLPGGAVVDPPAAPGTPAGVEISTPPAPKPPAELKGAIERGNIQWVDGKVSAKTSISGEPPHLPGQDPLLPISPEFIHRTNSFIMWGDARPLEAVTQLISLPDEVDPDIVRRLFPEGVSGLTWNGEGKVDAIAKIDKYLQDRRQIISDLKAGLKYTESLKKSDLKPVQGKLIRSATPSSVETSLVEKNLINQGAILKRGDRDKMSDMHPSWYSPEGNAMQMEHHAAFAWEGEYPEESMHWAAPDVGPMEGPVGLGGYIGPKDAVEYGNLLLSRGWVRSADQFNYELYGLSDKKLKTLEPFFNQILWGVQPAKVNLRNQEYMVEDVKEGKSYVFKGQDYIDANSNLKKTLQGARLGVGITKKITPPKGARLVDVTKATGEGITPISSGKPLLESLAKTKKGFTPTKIRKHAFIRITGSSSDHLALFPEHFLALIENADTLHELFGGSAVSSAFLSNPNLNVVVNELNTVQLALLNAAKNDPGGLLKDIEKYSKLVREVSSPKLTKDEAFDAIRNVLNPGIAKGDVGAYAVAQWLSPYGKPINVDGKLVFRMSGQPLPVGVATLTTGGKIDLKDVSLLASATRFIDLMKQAKVFDVTSEDAWVKLGSLGRGDVVFLDPEYIGNKPAYGVSSRTDLTAEGAIDRVNREMRQAWHRGVKMLYTNSLDSTLAEALERQGWKVEEIDRGTNKVKELIARNFDLETKELLIPPMQELHDGVRNLLTDATGMPGPMQEDLWESLRKSVLEHDTARASINAFRLGLEKNASPIAAHLSPEVLVNLEGLVGNEFVGNPIKKGSESKEGPDTPLHELELHSGLSYKDVTSAVRWTMDRIKTTLPLYEKATLYGGEAAKWANWGFVRVRGWLNKAGGPAAEIGDGIVIVGNRGRRGAERQMMAIENAAKKTTGMSLKSIPLKQIENMTKVSHGFMKKSELPPSIRAFYDKVRIIQDRMRAEGGNVGIFAQGTKEVTYTGRIFPLVLNKKGKAIEARFQSGGITPEFEAFLAKHYGTDPGTPYDSRDDSLAAFIRNRENSKFMPVIPYLEGTRGYDWAVEYLELDWRKYLPTVNEKAWKAIEASRQWKYLSKVNDEGISSQQFPRLNKLIELVRARDKWFGDQIDEYIKSHLGIRSNTPLEGLFQDYSSYLTYTKLWLRLGSAVRNGIDRYGMGATQAPLGMQLRATLQFPPLINMVMPSAQKIQKMVRRSGGLVNASFMAETMDIQNGILLLGMWPFTGAESGNQVYAALLGVMRTYRDLGLLATEVERLSRKGTDPLLTRITHTLRNLAHLAVSWGETNQAATMDRVQRSFDLDKSPEEVQDLLRDFIENGKMLTPRMIDEIMTRAALDRTGAAVMGNDRMWYSKSFMRSFFKFKNFGMKTQGVINRDVLGQAAKGNFRPFRDLILFMIASGEIYQLYTDVFFGRESSVLMSLAKRPDKRNLESILFALAADFGNGGGLGLLWDVGYGIVDAITGPSAGPPAHLADAIKKIIITSDLRGAGQAVIDGIGDEVAVIGDITTISRRIDRWMGNDKNKSFEVEAWQRRSYDFKRAEKERHLGQKIEGVLMDIGGRGRDAISKAFMDQSSAQIMGAWAAKQINVGDKLDAAEFFRGSLEGSHDWKELAEKLRSHYAQRLSRSPIPLSVENRDKMLKAYGEGWFQTWASPFAKKDALQLQKKWQEDWDDAFLRGVGKARRGNSSSSFNTIVDGWRDDPDGFEYIQQKALAIASATLPQERTVPLEERPIRPPAAAIGALQQEMKKKIGAQIKILKYLGIRKEDVLEAFDASDKGLPKMKQRMVVTEDNPLGLFTSPSLIGGKKTITDTVTGETKPSARTKLRSNLEHRWDKW